jgi:large subunit ribosomal protein L9
MQIILLEKVINLGTLGDVVKVKDGYARNFLIPHGKAKRATPANLAEFENRRAELEKAQNEALAGAQALGAKLDGLMVQVTQKAGVDGKLFGSVTNSDIAEALKKQGFDVVKAAIRMPDGPIKAIGDTQLKIALHADVVVGITVSVLGEQA